MSGVELADPQQMRVYAWERKFRYSEEETLKKSGIQEWVNWACDMYAVPHILCKPDPNPKAKISHYWNDNKISLARKHMNMMVCLHEAAHGIHTHYFGFPAEAHGPEWLGIYVRLLTKARFAPKIAITASLEAAGLLYRKGCVSPGTLKKKGPYNR